MATSCSALLAANTEAWHDATHHPFLEACQNGSIQSAQFDAWLVQVSRAFLVFCSTVLI
jgi:thiaminase/transcriptional activator TenA